jgi:uncharacterized membrane protein HdeD (DUF308 family)
MAKSQINFFKTVRNAVKHWYLPLIAGIIFIVVGIWVFATPAESYVALSIVFSITFLVNGIFETYFSIANKDELENWGWSLALGIMNLIVGVVLLLHPEISMTTLPFFVGFVVLYRSIMAVSFSLDLKNYGILDWGSLMVVGILGILFGFILIWNPVFAGLSLVVWTGLAFIVSGVYSIYFSLKLKKLSDLPEKISSQLKTKWQEVQSEIQNEISKISK